MKVPEHPIITRTLADLLSRPANARRRVKELHLTRYFTTIELDDGSVGACASYYRHPDAILSTLEASLVRFFSTQAFVPALQTECQKMVVSELGSDRQAFLLCSSVLTTMACALSAPIIRARGDDVFYVSQCD